MWIPDFVDSFAAYDDSLWSLNDEHNYRFADMDADDVMSAYYSELAALGYEIPDEV